MKEKSIPTVKPAESSLIVTKDKLFRSEATMHLPSKKRVSNNPRQNLGKGPRLMVRRSSIEGSAPSVALSPHRVKDEKQVREGKDHFRELQITALGPKSVGIDEFTCGYPILIPNARLGEVVKARIQFFYPLKKAEATTLKKHGSGYALRSPGPRSPEEAFPTHSVGKAIEGLLPAIEAPLRGVKHFTFKKAKYAVAQISGSFYETSVSYRGLTVGPNFIVGDVLTVKLNSIVVQTKNSRIGIAYFDVPTPVSPGETVADHPLGAFKIIIPFSTQNSSFVAKVGQEIKIKLTRIKLNYSFAKLLGPVIASETGNLASVSLSEMLRPAKQVAEPRLHVSPASLAIEAPLREVNTLFSKGSKITLTLPKFATTYAKHIVIRLTRPSIISKTGDLVGVSPVNYGTMRDSKDVFFINNLLGAKFGDKIRVKFTKVGSQFVIGEIIRLSPNSPFKKIARTRKNINEMLANGMHFGEKVIKSQAGMRSYIWNNPLAGVKPKGPRSPGFPTHCGGGAIEGQRVLRSYAPARSANLVPLDRRSPFPPRGEKASVGPQKRNVLHSDASLQPKIKKGRHIINLFKTRRCLNISLNQLTKYAAKGRTFLFVGTKKPAAGLIARAALFSKTAFFVNTRWLGGMLTNWKTIIKSIYKIRPILKEKQKIISTILQKRSTIQNRLIKKIMFLRKKSKLLIKKGKQLIAQVKTGVSPSIALPTQSFSKDRINIKRKEFFQKGQLLLKNRDNLLNKQKLLKEKTLSIEKRGGVIARKYKILLNQFTTTHKKLHDLRLLFLLNKELRNVIKLAKRQGRTQHTLSSAKFKKLTHFGGVPLDRQGFLQRSRPLVTSQKLWPIPTPPQALLNKIVISLREISNPLCGLRAPAPVIEGHTPHCGVNLDSIEFSEIFPGVVRSATRKVESQDTTSGVSRNNALISDNFYENSPYDLENLGPSIAFPTLCERTASSGDRGPSFLKNEQLQRVSHNLHGGVNPLSGINPRSVIKSIILPQILSTFSRFLPYIKNAIYSLLRIMLIMEKKMTELRITLAKLKNQLASLMLFNNKINEELKFIQTKYTSEQQIIRVLRRKLKRQEAEKKLLQFLPKLRYLPIPKNKISLAIQILMKRVVDPKLKYPMDLIYAEKLRKKSKKIAAARKKKWQRLETYFGGIANMIKFKKTQISNNVAIIIGQQEEMTAVRECKKLGIKMFHIVDTNCNPSLADHFIPSNDDSRNSIKYLLTKIVTRIRLAHKIRTLILKK